MLEKSTVDAEEDRLYKLANSLPDELRKAFYREASNKLKDPDTYAALNWFFIAGLHHFYLGKRLNGILDLAVFSFGVILIIVQATWSGIALIILVTVWELWALFRAQIIVQDWNNRIYSKLLDKYKALNYSQPPTKTS